MKFTSVEFFKTPEISAENEFMRGKCESQLNVKSKSVEFFKRPEAAAFKKIILIDKSTDRGLN